MKIIRNKKIIVTLLLCICFFALGFVLSFKTVTASDIENNNTKEKNITILTNMLYSNIIETTVITMEEMKNNSNDILTKEDLKVVDTNNNLSSKVLASSKSYNGISEGQIVYNTEFTYYTASTKCCSPQSDGKFYTADGTQVWIGMSNPYIVACKWLPLGSKVEVDGIVYTVRDTGGAAHLKRVGGLDFFVPEGVDRCYQLGRKKGIPVKIVSINI